MDADPSLSRADIDSFHRHGYLVVRQAISQTACQRLKTALLRRVENHQYTISVPRDKVFPEPAKYTLAASDWAEPDLAFIVEHPVVLDAVEAVLGKPPVLTAYVAYVRPPNDDGSRAHCDHKRWRPVGSSLNWCFTIVPLVDFDEALGPLLVCPGSHKLIQPVHRDGERTLSVTPPDKSKLGPFVDANLKCGDLLLLHGNTWHEAPPNQSDDLRIGIFNKYAACDAPPAAGYFKWSNAVYESLGPSGKRLLAVHTDRALKSTRLVLERRYQGNCQVLLRESDEKGWTLPGGLIDDGRNRALEAGLDGAWDTGNLIGALGELCLEQLGIELPWMSYVADHEEDNHLCRVYGATLTNEYNNPGLPADTKWFSAPALDRIVTPCPFLSDATRQWLGDDAELIRGKGKSELQCLPTDGLNQYAD